MTKQAEHSERFAEGVNTLALFVCPTGLRLVTGLDERRSAARNAVEALSVLFPNGIAEAVRGPLVRASNSPKWTQSTTQQVRSASIAGLAQLFPELVSVRACAIHGPRCPKVTGQARSADGTARLR